MVICVYTVYLSVARYIHSKPDHVKIYIHVTGNFNRGTEECRSAIATDPFFHCLLIFSVTYVLLGGTGGDCDNTS
jgi:hypothetical protein